MQTRERIIEVINLNNSLKELLEQSFEHVKIDKPENVLETKWHVYGYKCVSCKEIVGKVERIEHLIHTHNTPIFAQGGTDALRWILDSPKLCPHGTTSKACIEMYSQSSPEDDKNVN